MNTLNIVYKAIKDIIPYEKNPRKNDGAVEYVANSIKEFGFKVPVIISSDGVVVAGHTRLKAAKKLKLKEVPCIVADDLDEEQLKAFRLADNRVSEFADWDIDLLNDELTDIIDIDMSDFGFELNLDDEEEPEAEEVDTPEPPKKAKSKLGDLYELGEHRLICGDGTDEGVLDRLMEGEAAELLLTDPPYGIDKDKGIKTTYGDSAHNAYEYEGEWDGETPSAEAFDNIRERSVHAIIFGGNYFTDKLPLGTHWIVWDKVGDIDFHNPFSDCELAWTDYDKVITKKYTAIQQGFVSVEKEKRVHPTQKPVKLIGDILNDYTESGDTVLDCFGGSGSTLMACEQLDRKCLMCELDPRYVDVIIARYEKLTGKKAKFLGNTKDQD